MVGIVPVRKETGILDFYLTEADLINRFFSGQFGSLIAVVSALLINTATSQKGHNGHPVIL